MSLSRKSNDGPRIDTNVPPWPSVVDFFEFVATCDLRHATCELTRELPCCHPPSSHEYESNAYYQSIIHITYHDSNLVSCH